MRILECAQGTQEWLDARLGLVTGSNMKRVMQPTRMKFSDQATDYACELIAERLTGGRDPWKWQGETADMHRGNYTEHEARLFWSMERNEDVRQVGLCVHENERWAVSPDGLIGEHGGLELKCPAPKTQCRWLLDNHVPSEHLPQIHGALIVTGRDYWDFLAYCISLPPLLIRVTPSEYTTKLRECLDRFNELYDLIYNQIVAQRDRSIDAAIDREEPEPAYF